MVVAKQPFLAIFGEWGINTVCDDCYNVEVADLGEGSGGLRPSLYFG